MTGRGQQTRVAIVDHAIGVAAALGLESLTIGSLANALKMSKSGLFAHFQSKEQLQLAVLEEAAQRFVAAVVVPSLKKPRGEPRVQALFDNWIGWSKAQPGGCVIYAASAELDDRPGPLRDFLRGAYRDLKDTFETAARIAVRERHFRKDLDLEQFSFEVNAIAIGYNHAARLLDEPRAEQWARKSLEALLERARA